MNLKRPVPLWVAACVVIVIAASFCFAASKLIDRQNNPPTQQAPLMPRKMVPASVSGIAPLIAIPSASSGTIATSTTIDTSAWKKYRNRKFGFELRFPKEWNAYTRGEGEYMSASGDESRFSISPSLPEDGTFVTIDTLGSDAMGAFSTATSLQKYVELFQKAATTDSSTFSSVVTEFDIAGRRSVWFHACSVLAPCSLYIFFQDGQQVYQISKPDPIDHLLFKEIFSTWRFY